VTVREFPALGFDPAPGDPAALESAARAMTGAGTVLADAGTAAGRLRSTGWTGDAADAFRGDLADLPRDIDHAARSHRAAATALADFGTGLVSRQRRAAELESRAAALRQQESAAVAEVNRIAARTAPAGSPEFADLRTRYDTARTRATTLGSSLQETLAEARRLHAAHRTAAAEAARAIRAAGDAPYEKPGRLSRAWSAAKAWITAHAETLRGISSTLKGISAVLGVLSFVPGLQFLAPFAVALGAAALLLDTTLCLAGQGNWKSLAIDAALTILPTGPVLRAVHRLPGATRALKAANRAIPPSVKGPLFRATNNLPEGITRTQWNEAARVVRAEASHLGDDVVVQGSRAGWSARPTSDIDFGIRVDPDRFDELVRQRFGSPNPGSSKERTMLQSFARGRLHTRESGLRGVRGQLSTIFEQDIDISIIRRGGPFDNEPWLPLQ
jgi:hypothetical protein